MTAQLRPRDPWEGLDLGFALARVWYWPLWRLWWLTAAPLAVLCVAIAGGMPDWWILAVWWLKPLFEVPLLLLASQRLFGEERSSGSVADLLRRGWLQLRSPLPRRVLPYVLWRRLSPRRSFLMPVAVLEGLTGAPARQRRSILNAGGGAASWLTIVCYHFEVILWGGLLLGLYLLVPEELPRLDIAALLSDSDSWGYWLSVVAYLLVFSVIAPFYVCGGFALYLNRRTELEAWDLELTFRRDHPATEDRRQLASRPATLRTLPALMLALSVALALPATPSPAAVPSDPARAQTIIHEVLQDEAFNRGKEVTRWRAINRDSDAEDTGDVAGILVEFARKLALILKWFLLGAAVVVLALLLRGLLQAWRPDWFKRPTRRLESASPGMSEAIGADQPLPSDVAATVRARIAAGDRRGAMSLLYRASLAHLASQGLHLPDGATEGDLLTAATDALPEERLWFLRELIRVRLRSAYSQRVPPAEQVLELLATWQLWTTPGPGCAA